MQLRLASTPAGLALAKFSLSATSQLSSYHANIQYTFLTIVGILIHI